MASVSLWNDVWRISLKSSPSLFGDPSRRSGAARARIKCPIISMNGRIPVPAA